jgi:Na+-transporting NADH:ubiquinone oxidoreductase subunit NqrF
MNEILLSMGMFSGVILLLVALIIFARSRLVTTGHIKLNINDEKELTIEGGGKLLNTLAQQKIFLPRVGEVGRVHSAKSSLSQVVAHYFKPKKHTSTERWNEKAIG